MEASIEDIIPVAELAEKWGWMKLEKAILDGEHSLGKGLGVRDSFWGYLVDVEG